MNQKNQNDQTTDCACEFYRNKNLKLKNKNYCNCLFIVSGPTYSNNHLHIGSCYNLILKKNFNRLYYLAGFVIDSDLIHGLDQQGLPVYNRVVKFIDFNEDGLDHHTHVNDLARKVADYFGYRIKKDCESIGVQVKDFYKTSSLAFKIFELMVLSIIYEKKYTVFGMKLLQYCLNCKTVLSFSEIETKVCEVETACIKFQIVEHDLKINKPVYCLIWTTTVYNIPHNQAIAFDAKGNYCLFWDKNADCFVICSDSFATNNKFDLEKKQTIVCEKIRAMRYLNFFTGSKNCFVEDQTVDMSLGTGFVHLSSRHSVKDKKLLEKNKIFLQENDETLLFDNTLVYSCNNEKIRQPFEQAVKKILSFANANKHVFYTRHENRLKNVCWRCKNPVVVSSFKQFGIDLKQLNSQIEKDIEQQVIFFPESESLKNMFKKDKSRDFWCLSRQKTYGLFIPYYVCGKCGHANLNTASIFFYIRLLRKYLRSDIWLDFEQKREKHSLICEKCRSVSGFTFSKEVLDVWFDSSVVIEYYFMFVKKKLHANTKILLIEGNDQFRGWFNVCSIVSKILRNRICFSEVLTHGFILKDKKQNLKISKSAGNFRKISEILKTYDLDSVYFALMRQKVSFDLEFNHKVLLQAKKVIEIFSAKIEKIFFREKFALSHNADNDWLLLFFLSLLLAKSIVVKKPHNLFVSLQIVVKILKKKSACDDFSLCANTVFLFFELLKIFLPCYAERCIKRIFGDLSEQNKQKFIAAFEKHQFVTFYYYLHFVNFVFLDSEKKLGFNNLAISAECPKRSNAIFVCFVKNNEKKIEFLQKKKTAKFLELQKKIRDLDQFFFNQTNKCDLYQIIVSKQKLFCSSETNFLSFNSFVTAFLDIIRKKIL